LVQTPSLAVSALLSKSFHGIRAWRKPAVRPSRSSHQGKKAIEKVARNQPAAYLKILALLVPREMKVEHSGEVKAMSDEQLEAAIEMPTTHESLKN